MAPASPIITTTTLPRQSVAVSPSDRSHGGLSREPTQMRGAGRESMKPDGRSLNRRELLARGSRLTLGAAMSGSPDPLLAAELPALDVAYAGSMGSLMEGPVKTSVARTL